MRTRYKTRQRDMVLGLLESDPDAHITANGICERLWERGERIGRSTVYRQLESLVSEGIVNKYSFDDDTPACYEHVAPDSHADGDHPCFHCKCEKCGRLIHLHCDEMAEIQAHLEAEHKFKMDPMRTFFYGLCEHCAR